MNEAQGIFTVCVTDDVTPNKEFSFPFMVYYLLCESPWIEKKRKFLYCCSFLRLSWGSFKRKIMEFFIRICAWWGEILDVASFVGFEQKFGEIRWNSDRFSFFERLSFF